MRWPAFCAGTCREGRMRGREGNGRPPASWPVPIAPLPRSPTGIPKHGGHALAACRGRPAIQRAAVGEPQSRMRQLLQGSGCASCSSCSRSVNASPELAQGLPTQPGASRACAGTAPRHLGGRWLTRPGRETLGEPKSGVLLRNGRASGQPWAPQSLGSIRPSAPAAPAMRSRWMLPPGISGPRTRGRDERCGTNGAIRCGAGW